MEQAEREKKNKDREGEKTCCNFIHHSHGCQPGLVFQSFSWGHLYSSLLAFTPLFSSIFASFIAELLSPARLIYSGSELSGLGLCNLQELRDFLSPCHLLLWHSTVTKPVRYLPLFAAHFGHMWNPGSETITGLPQGASQGTLPSEIKSDRNIRSRRLTCNHKSQTIKILKYYYFIKGFFWVTYLLFNQLKMSIAFPRRI